MQVAMQLKEGDLRHVRGVGWPQPVAMGQCRHEGVEPANELLEGLFTPALGQHDQCAVVVSGEVAGIAGLAGPAVRRLRRRLAAPRGQIVSATDRTSQGRCGRPQPVDDTLPIIDVGRARAEPLPGLVDDFVNGRARQGMAPRRRGRHAPVATSQFGQSFLVPGDISPDELFGAE
jgi:hypothetical protein